MNVLIIEDEIPAANQLTSLIKDVDSTIHILDVLDSNAAIEEWFRNNNHADLIFSDIELLDGPVFNSLENLTISIPIIFITAYNQYMLEAFETSGISYLLKPLETAKLEKAIKKYHQLSEKTTHTAVKDLIANLPSLTSSNQYKTRIAVKMSSGIYLLKTEEISCIRMKNGLAHAYKSDHAKAYVLSTGITNLFKQLDPSNFFMVNRGEIVHIEAITKIESYFNDRLAIHVEGQATPLITSAAKTKSFRKWINN